MRGTRCRDQAGEATIGIEGRNLVTVAAFHRGTTMISQAELDRFYEGLITEVRARGGVCAITSGMACVQYGIAQSTKDCDILCSVESLTTLLGVIRESRFHGVGGSYRGHLTPPLDRRWLAGGWTSHFEWEVEGAKAHLDVFAVAPRGSTDWTKGISGLLVGMHTVAEMKRTDRGKDWPFANALGGKLIESGELDGWLHIFEVDSLKELFKTVPLPDDIVAKRPALQLLRDGDPRLKQAVFGEVTFWQELDRHRIRLHEGFIKKYMLAVKRDPAVRDPELLTQHTLRVKHAETLLPHCPILDYGIDRLIADAKQSTAELVASEVLNWLPNIKENFFGLRAEPA
jgi:hypothetical protein